MENPNSGEKDQNHEAEFKRFAAKRIILFTLIGVVAIWVVGVVIGYFEKPAGVKTAKTSESRVAHESSKNSLQPETLHKAVEKEPEHTLPEVEGHETTTSPMKSKEDVAGDIVTTPIQSPATVHEATAAEHEEQAQEHEEPVLTHEAQALAPEHQEQAQTQEEVTPTQEVVEKKSEHTVPTTHEEKTAEQGETPAHGGHKAEETKPRAKGVAFVEATIAPLDYELNKRFWGWRSNDILNFTDNVNNFQLGVLEVTRRTVVALTERISRTGATAAFDENLENGMNWLMIKARKYWFPSPESKYNASLSELKTYKEKLEKGEANFYIRTDNLIPLLMAYEDLLGSCEENLVKTKEDDGSPVSFFKADDYFFYAKGVVSAMGTILEAVQEDFIDIVETRGGVDVLHHAIESCHHASEIDPWIITNSPPSGILANHRANMAAPLSHARFYIGVLIKTLST
jgi:hypothetical protein